MLNSHDSRWVVYTPELIADFMLQSCKSILVKYFGEKDGLSGANISIMDPFGGDGVFITRAIEQVAKEQLTYKYDNCLYFNEILPHDAAITNIENAYSAKTGEYKQFQNDMQVDIFEQNGFPKGFIREGVVPVVISNPPYKARQKTDNSNNKNKTYNAVDSLIRESYSRDSLASKKGDLYDPYVRAFKFASHYIDKGVVAYVSNNKFIDGISFDGMRKHLAQDFDAIYILDLRGDIRNDSMRDGKSLGEEHTVFGLEAMVGISITFLVKTNSGNPHKIYYYSCDYRATREEKLQYLAATKSIDNVVWETIVPNKENNWIYPALSEFNKFIPMGTKLSKKESDPETIFKIYSLGASTNRDAWAYSFDKDSVSANMSRLISCYNSELDRWGNRTKEVDMDNFLINDETLIKWSSRLKEGISRKEPAAFSEARIRRSMYRPFCPQYLYFDKLFTHRRGLLHFVFPTPHCKNIAICVQGRGGKHGFSALMVNIIPDAQLVSNGQCFPLYTYNEDGSGETENITDFAAKKFSTNYNKQVSKLEIFYYIYAMLHSAYYKDKYSGHLRLSFPHIPFVSMDAWDEVVKAGRILSDMHTLRHTKRYNLSFTNNGAVDYAVQKMTINKSEGTLKYNNSLTISGIPRSVWEYKIGNKSALEWVVSQYQIKTDKRSGITSNPNTGDPAAIIRTIETVVSISVETVNLIKKLDNIINGEYYHG